MSDSHPLLAEYPLITTIPLLWSDEDTFGHVNNLSYLRWAEGGRVEYLQAVGLWTEMPPTGPGPILASQKCDYKAQLKYPDTVYVGTKVTKIGNTSFRMQHRIVSRDVGIVAAEVDSTLVMFDYKEQKPTPLTDEMKLAIREFESRPVETPEAVRA